MKTIGFETLEEAVECYGRANLIPIDYLPQVIFYIKNGCQPKFVWEKELQAGRVTFWFIKAETTYVYKKWKESNNKK